MLNFLGITRHLSTTAGYAKRIGWLLHEDVTQSPFPVTGVSFTGAVKTEQGDLPIAITHGEQENYLELTFPALPIGRWPYAIHAQDESGEDLRLFAGYIGAVESVPPIEASTVYDIPVMGIAIPIEAGKTIKAQWLSNTAASLAAQQAQQDASSTRTDADTASQAAATATGAATTAVERAKEAEGYAGAAQASKVAAGNSAASASTSAADAAHDARSANDAKTAVEGIVSDFTQTVSNGEQTISAAKEEAVTVIQAKQADSVLAVGRAQKTATDKVASAQGAAVTAVETAKTEAVQAVQTAQAEAMETITPLVERTEAAKGEIDKTEGRVNTTAIDASQSAQTASNAAIAAQQALAAIPQVDAAGNMTLAGGLTTAATINANGGVRSTAVLSVLENMMTLGGGYAAKAFDLSGYVDLRSIAFANAVNVSKLHYPYLMDKDTVIFHETVTGNNFLSYPVIVFDRYCFAWGTFPPSSTVLSMGGSYMKYEIGEHNAFMGFALGQTSIAAQSVSEVGPPYIYLKMYSRANEQTTFSVYYNIGDGDRVFTQAGLTRPINRLFLICEWVDTTSMRVSVGVVYGTSNLGVTSRQVTIYRMGVIAVDYYAVGEKVIPFFSSNTTVTSITDIRRALGLSIHPGMLITDYFATSN